MKRRVISLIMTVAILMSMALISPARADAFALQDMDDYSRGRVLYSYKSTKTGYQQYTYVNQYGQTSAIVDDFVLFLRNNCPQLVYQGISTSGWIYHTFRAAYGYSYKHFTVRSNGVNITPSCCLAISYKDNTIHVRFSEDAYITDMGYRTTLSSSSGSGNSGSTSSGFAIASPANYGGGQARYEYSDQKSSYLMKVYSVQYGNSSSFVDNYVSWLDWNNRALVYQGVYVSGDWVYHTFRAASGYSVQHFKVSSYGQDITPSCCLAISYNGKNIYVRYSNDCYITE